MAHQGAHEHTGPGSPSPELAAQAPPEDFIYVACLHEDTRIDHPDLRHHDVSDPGAPKLRSKVWLGGLLGHDGAHPTASGPLNEGPQMLQCSLEGERVYVSNSLSSTWDNQFYPELRGWLTKLDRQADGSYAVDPDFFVDFHDQTDGACPPEIQLPGGDCTTEIFQ